jgi:hypothetical protein
MNCCREVVRSASEFRNSGHSNVAETVVSVVKSVPLLTSVAKPISKSGRKADCFIKSNEEVEGLLGSAPWRRGRTISQRPRRQTDHASRPPPTIVRCHSYLYWERPRITDGYRGGLTIGMFSARNNAK